MMTPDILGSDDWVDLVKGWILISGFADWLVRVACKPTMHVEDKMLGRLANRVYSGIRVLRPGLCDWAVECR